MNLTKFGFFFLTAAFTASLGRAYDWETRWEFSYTNKIALCSSITLPSGTYKTECPGLRAFGNKMMGVREITELCQLTLGDDWVGSGVVDTRFKGFVIYGCQRPHLVLRGTQK